MWAEKSMYGRKYMGIVRSAFVVDEKGKIAAAFYKVSPKDTFPKSADALKPLRAVTAEHVAPSGPEPARPVDASPRRGSRCIDVRSARLAPVDDGEQGCHRRRRLGRSMSLSD